jgi:hypothetical protein
MRARSKYLKATVIVVFVMSRFLSPHAFAMSIVAMTMTESRLHYGARRELNEEDVIRSGDYIRQTDSNVVKQDDTPLSP